MEREAGKNLKEYFSQQNIDVVDYFLQQGVLNHTYKYFDSIDRDIMGKIMMTNIYQREFNKIVIKHISDIKILAERRNIKILILKGIYLAEILYNPPEQRKFSDIDILIRIEDIQLNYLLIIL